MSYPISSDGSCPYCRSNDVLYIILIEKKHEVFQSAQDDTSQRAKEAAETLTETKNENNLGAGKEVMISPCLNLQEKDLETVKSDSPSKCKYEIEDKSKNKKDRIATQDSGCDTSSLAEGVENKCDNEMKANNTKNQVAGDTVDSDNDLADILKKLLKIGRAYKLSDKGTAEIPSFQCRSCHYGFNLDWSQTNLEAIFKSYLENESDEGLSAEHNQQGQLRQDHQWGSFPDYASYYQYYQYYCLAAQHQQQQHANSNEGVIGNPEGTKAEKTNEKISENKNSDPVNLIGNENLSSTDVSGSTSFASPTVDVAMDRDKKRGDATVATGVETTNAEHPSYGEYLQQYYSAAAYNVPQDVHSSSSQDVPTTSSESSTSTCQTNTNSKSGFVTEFKDYAVTGHFNATTGRFQKVSSDQYWTSKGLPSDKDFRQMSHFFDPNSLNEVPCGELKQSKNKKKLSYTQVQKLKERKKIKKHKSMMQSLLS